MCARRALHCLPVISTHRISFRQPYCSKLKSVYHEILNNPETYLEPLLSSTNTRKEPDAAILLLYFLEYPNLVRTCRLDVSGAANCHSTESFQLADISNSIAKDKLIGKWCRSALASSQEHHGMVLASCIGLMGSIFILPTPAEKKKVSRRIILGREKNIRKACKVLHTDLADVVTRQDGDDNVPFDTVPNAIMLQMNILRIEFGDNAAITMLQAGPRNQDFDQALLRHRDSMSPEILQHFRASLGTDMSMEELTAALQVPHNPTMEERPECDADGCTKGAANQCSRCKRVGYCSKECQLKDWKARHKAACNSKKKNKSATGNNEASVQAAAAAARVRARPALLEQDRRLEGNEADYVIVLPTGNQDCGVFLSNGMGSLMFKALREKAASGSLHAVWQIYDFLLHAYADMKDITRKQLQNEYGVDPLSDACKER